MKREDGFYWVLISDNEWIVAEWFRGSFFLCGIFGSLDSEEVIEIDENRLSRFTK